MDVASVMLLVDSPMKQAPISRLGALHMCPLQHVKSSSAFCVSLCNFCTSKASKLSAICASSYCYVTYFRREMRQLL